MPLNQERLSALEEEEERLTSLIESNPDADDYEFNSSRLSKIGSVLNKHYEAYRKLDDNGQLKANPKATRLPASSSDDPKAKETDYFFEPSVAEARDMYRRDPELIKRLGLSTKWQTGVSVPQLSMPIMDASGHAPSGWNVQPAKSFIDTLSDTEEPYTALANHLWEQRMAEAKERGEVVKRYRDIQIAPGQLGDYVKGGAEYLATRQVAPAVMGAANAYSAGMAGPYYDAGRDLYDYTQSRPEGRTIPPEHQVVTDPMTGMPMGTNETQPAPYDSRDLPPSSRELELRSPLATMAGGVAAYGFPGNPANLVQEGLSSAMGYAKGNIPGKLINSAISGAATNVLESAVGRGSEAIGRGENPLESYSLEEAALDTFLGGGGGVLGDVAAQAAGGYRNAYRESRRDLQPLINAGGDTSFIGGVEAPPQVEEFLKRASAPRAVGSPGAMAADELAPKIQKSLVDQQAAEKARIAQQTEEYFSHPVYGQIRTSARPLVESLINLAQQGRVNAPLSGGTVAFNRDNIRKIREEFGSNWAEVTQVPREKAAEFVGTHDGVPIDHQLAVELFDLEVPTNMVPVIVVDPMNAREVTAAEDWINDRLRHAKVQGGNNDPVYMAMDAGAKQMRDKFQLWRDEAGNLVNPPPETRSSQPYSPSGDIPPPADPSQAVSVLPKPRQVGETRPQPEAKPGVGPGRPRMFGPFDMRAATQGGERASMMPRPRDIVGPPAPDAPEAIRGLGPRRDPRRAGASMEALEPHPVLALHGEALALRRPEASQAAADAPPDTARGVPQPINHGEFVDSPSAEPELSIELQEPSGYSRYEAGPDPQMEGGPTARLPAGSLSPRELPPPPSTERGMPRNPLAPNQISEESLSTLAGDAPFRGEPELTEEVFQREYGPTEPTIEAEVEPIRGETLEQFQARGGKTGAPIPPDIQAKIDDGTLPSEAQQHAVNEGIRERYPAQRSQTEAPTGKRFAILDQQDGALREKTFATMAEARTEANRLGAKFRSKGRFKVKGVDAPDTRGPLEMMIDDQLTADREQVAKEWEKAEEDIASGREARTAEAQKMGELSETQQAVEEALGQANDMARRFEADDSTRRQWVAEIVSQKLGTPVTVKDLVDLGLITGLGISIPFKRKAKAAPEAPKQQWPQEPRATLDNGDEVKGFSALRRQQHLAQGGIETAKQKVGAMGDQSIRNRIIEFNRGDNITHDNSLLEEAQRIGAEDELWRAAATAGWLDLKGRARGGTKGEGLIGRAYDTAGPRLDALSGYVSGAGRNPLSAGPSDISDHLWRAMLADPARRLFNQSGGTLGARYGNDAATIYNLLFGEEQPEQEQQP